MRVRVWRARGDERQGDDRRQSTEDPAWRELEAHARSLEAMARAIRVDVSKRNATTASTQLGNLMRQSQQAYDDVGRLLGAAAAATDPKKRMVEI